MQKDGWPPGQAGYKGEERGFSLMALEANGVNIINIRTSPNYLQMIKPPKEGPVGEALKVSLG